MLVKHGQPEAPQILQYSLKWGRFKGGEVPCAQVVQREGRQLGLRTDAEAVRKSAEDRCLKSEATPAVDINIINIVWDECQIDRLQPEQLVNARK